MKKYDGLCVAYVMLLLLRMEAQGQTLSSSPSTPLPPMIQDVSPEEPADSQGVFSLSPAQREGWIEKAETFLNGLTTFQAQFFQITHHPQGLMESREGVLRWMRPGHVRFDYKGEPFLQVAADGESFRQKDEDGLSLAVDIDSTPAGLILKKNLRFQRDALIKDVVEQKDAVFITLTHKDDPEGAALTLVFRKRPFFLVQWTTVDTTGRMIDVMLHEVRMGVPMKKSDFILK